jgi:hypothetical protein
MGEERESCARCRQMSAKNRRGNYQGGLEEGVLDSPSPKGPLRPAFPAAVQKFDFPFPEDSVRFTSTQPGRGRIMAACDALSR